uniref:Eukaryotic translation initiation factor 4 gamma 2 n=1 Tax=Lygus hesperus TaxID=30085 RepID=A0A0A9WDE4_LYGHE
MEASDALAGTASTAAPSNTNRLSNDTVTPPGSKQDTMGPRTEEKAVAEVPLTTILHLTESFATSVTASLSTSDAVDMLTKLQLPTASIIQLVGQIFFRIEETVSGTDVQKKSMIFNLYLDAWTDSKVQMQVNWESCVVYILHEIPSLIIDSPSILDWFAYLLRQLEERSLLSKHIFESLAVRDAVSVC